MKTREQIAQALAASGYIADGELATAISLMQLLKRPLLLEGEAGVGKTEVAKALASVHATELIRLQCYEGLDQSAALYEWNYQRQLLAIQAHRGDAETIEDQIFSEKYLLERPLLAAIRRAKAPVLLIDEIDRADDEFEAFLLELLSDFQVSIPELGTITATTIPHVILTSNGTRELSDALRRRCLYHYVDYPDVDREARIIMARINRAGASLSLQIARMVEGIRKEELRKVPGVAETLDWAAALVGLEVRDLHEQPEIVQETLMCLLKTHEDKSRVTREVTERLLGESCMSCCGSHPSYEETDEVSRLVAAKLAAFLRTLRDNAFIIGLHEGRDAAALMAAGYAEKPGLLRSAFKQLFSARKSDWDRFDGLFDAFWLGKRVRSRSISTGAAKAANNPSLKSLQDNSSQRNGSDAATDQVPSADEAPQNRGGEGRMEGASRADNISEIDFRRLADPDQIAEAHAAAARLAKTMRTRLTRRDLARRRGYRLDLRRTIHGNISHGGVPIRLVKRQRKEKPLRLVMLLDASGSMSMYTGVFLRFIHGVLDEFREAEAFLFHTRLAHVSDAMKEKDAARALDRLSIMAQGAGGGTKIGESLQTFNRWHAARVIHSRTCVMMVSDGYETGDAALLGREMAALAKRCRRIVWLNPMMAWPGYAPEAAGIKAALPHIDLYAPANTLKSLTELEPYLAKL